MSERCSISVVLTDFNGWAQTQKCLAALAIAATPPHQIIVVEHGTDDTTRVQIQRHFPDIVLLRGSPAQWWAEASNLGIEHALKQRSQYVMLLNNDCYVQPETIAALRRHITQEPTAIIAPVQQDAEDRRLLALLPSHNILLGFTTLDGPRKITDRMRANPLQKTRLIIGGRGVVIPSEVFRTVGFFDADTFPHYGADHDFFLRCASKGIPLFVAVDATVLIDRTRTSLSARSETLSLRNFAQSLIDIRSHRSLYVQSQLIKRYYPLPGFHCIGVALYVARYCLAYVTRRALYLFRQASGIARKGE